jgi:hypothetical protein
MTCYRHETRGGRKRRATNFVLDPYGSDELRASMSVQAGIQESLTEALYSSVRMSAFVEMTSSGTTSQIQADGLLVPQFSSSYWQFYLLIHNNRVVFCHKRRKGGKAELTENEYLFRPTVQGRVSHQRAKAKISLARRRVYAIEGNPKLATVTLRRMSRGTRLADLEHGDLGVYPCRRYGITDVIQHPEHLSYRWWRPF